MDLNPILHAWDHMCETLFLFMCVCLSVRTYKRVLTGVRRGHLISWSWTYRDCDAPD